MKSILHFSSVPTGSLVTLRSDPPGSGRYYFVIGTSSESYSDLIELVPADIPSIAGGSWGEGSILTVEESEVALVFQAPPVGDFNVLFSVGDRVLASTSGLGTGVYEIGALTTSSAEFSVYATVTLWGTTKPCYRVSLRDLSLVEWDPEPLHPPHEVGSSVIAFGSKYYNSAKNFVLTVVEVLSFGGYRHYTVRNKYGVHISHVPEGVLSPLKTKSKLKTIVEDPLSGEAVHVSDEKESAMFIPKNPKMPSLEFQLGIVMEGGFYLKVRACTENSTGCFYALPASMTSIKEGEVSPSLLNLTLEESTRLMDALWEAGIRPSPETMNLNPLPSPTGAITVSGAEDHINDLRTITFRLLDIVSK